MMMSAVDFSKRSTASELMDAQDCDFATFRDCLIDLAFVNRLTQAYRPTLIFLEMLARAGRLPKGRALHVLDIGSGYGDMLRAVARWAECREVAIDLTGLDKNPWSARAASEATPSAMDIRWSTADVFEYQSEQPVDLVISALFTHHLDNRGLIRFLRWMEATAELGWLINDLHRHPIPYHFFLHAAQTLRLHHFVQNDGPISIARSFVPDDWRRLLDAAGIAQGDVEIRWRMPFRLCVSRVRSL